MHRKTGEGGGAVLALCNAEGKRMAASRRTDAGGYGHRDLGGCEEHGGRMCACVYLVPFSCACDCG